MTRHPIAQIAPNGNPKSQETSALLPFSREIDYFSRRVSLGASTLTRFFTDDPVISLGLDGVTTLSWPLWGHRGAGRNHALDCAVMMLPSAALMILTLVAWGVFGVFATLADRGLDRLH